MLELMVTQDGGVPLVSKSWSGNASNSKIFRERSRALVDMFKESSTPRYLIADSKLYSKETIEEALQYIPFITRVPSSINLERKSIEKSLQVPINQWNKLDERNRYVSLHTEYAGQQQRWIIISSQDMENRSIKSIEKAKACEYEKLQKELKKLSSKRFSCKLDAEKALEYLKKTAKLHLIEMKELVEHKVYKKKGRPGLDSEFTIMHQVHGAVVENPSAIDSRIKQGSCYVLATTVL